MKYILVHWTATNETSILTEEFVRDKSLLQDTRKEGMIRFGDLNAKEPKDGWKSYLGRVVFVHGECFCMTMVYYMLFITTTTLTMC